MLHVHPHVHLEVCIPLNGLILFNPYRLYGGPPVIRSFFCLHIKPREAANIFFCGGAVLKFTPIFIDTFADV